MVMLKVFGYFKLPTKNLQEVIHIKYLEHLGNLTWFVEHPKVHYASTCCIRPTTTSDGTFKVGKGGKPGSAGRPGMPGMPGPIGPMGTPPGIPGKPGRALGDHQWSPCKNM